MSLPTPAVTSNNVSQQLDKAGRSQVSVSATCETLDVMWAPGPPAALLRLQAIGVEIKVSTASQCWQFANPTTARCGREELRCALLLYGMACGLRLSTICIPGIDTNTSRVMPLQEEMMMADDSMDEDDTVVGKPTVEVLEVTTADLRLTMRSPAPAGTREEYKAATEARKQVGASLCAVDDSTQVTFDACVSACTRRQPGDHYVLIHTLYAMPCRCLSIGHFRCHQCPAFECEDDIHGSSRTASRDCATSLTMHTGVLA